MSNRREESLKRLEKSNLNTGFLTYEGLMIKEVGAAKFPLSLGDVLNIMARITKKFSDEEQ